MNAKTLSKSEKIEMLRTFLEDAGESIIYGEQFPERTQNDIPTAQNINDEKATALAAQHAMARQMGYSPPPKAPKTKKRLQPKLTAELLNITGQDPIEAAKENPSEKLRYRLSVNATKEDTPFKALAAAGIIEPVARPTGNGIVNHTAFISSDLKDALLKSDIDGATPSIPETIELKNTKGLSLAHHVLSGKNSDIDDPVLIIRGKTSLVERFFTEKKMGYPNILFRCQTPAEECVASCRLSREVMDALISGNMEKDDIPLIRPLADIIEENQGIPDLDKSHELLEFAARYMPSATPQKHKESSEKDQNSNGTPPRMPEPAKALDEYSDEFLELGTSIGAQRRINGSIEYSLQFPIGVAADEDNKQANKKTADRLIQSLKNPKKTHPALSLGKRTRKTGEGIDRAIRYSIDDTKTLERLKEHVHYQPDAVEPYRLPERLLQDDNSYDRQTGVKLNETVNPILLAEDPENEDRAYLYFGVLRASAPKQSHIRLNHINRNLGLKDSHLVERITDTNGHYEIPAMQRISIPVEVAEQIFEQVVENEELEKKVSIDLWQESGITSQEMLDQEARALAGVMHASEKKQASPSQSSASKYQLTQDDKSLMRNNYVAGLKAIATAQTSQDHDSSMMLQAIVKDGPSYKHALIMRMNADEFKQYQKSNQTNIGDQTYTYQKNLSTQSIQGSDDKIRAIIIPNEEIGLLQDAMKAHDVEIPYIDQAEAGKRTLSTSRYAAFEDIRSARTVATNVFASQVQKEKIIDDSATHEEKAYKAILSGMHLVDEKLPETEELLERKKEIDQLKAAIPDFENHLKRYEDASETAKSLRDRGGSLPGVPEHADTIHLGASSSGTATRSLIESIKSLDASLEQDINFAATQKGRISTTILAIRVTPAQRKAIENLWAAQGNNEHYLRPPVLHKGALDGDDMMAVYPSEDMVNCLKAYDQKEINRKTEASPEHSQKKKKAALQAGYEQRWQKKTERPIPSKQLVDAVREWEGIGPKDRYERLHIAANEGNLNTVQAIAKELTDRPETKQRPALHAVLKDLVDTHSTGSRVLSIAKAACVLNDVASQGDAKHILQSRIVELETQITKRITEHVNQEIEAKIRNELEGDESKTSEKLKDKYTHWAKTETTQRVNKEIARQKPALEIALMALETHGCQGIDRKETSIELALERSVDALKTLKPILRSEGARSFNIKAEEEKLSDAAGQNDFTEHKINFDEETRIGSQHMLVLPVKGEHSVKQIKALIASLGESALRPPLQYVTEKALSPEERVSQRWKAAALVESHAEEVLHKLTGSEEAHNELRDLDTALFEYSELCPSRIDDTLEGETIIRYRSIKNSSHLKEDIGKLLDDMRHNKRYFKQLDDRYIEQNNGEKRAYYDVITRLSGSPLADKENKPIHIDEIASQLPNHQPNFAATIASQRAPATYVKLYLSDEAFAALSNLKGTKAGKHLFGNDALEEKIKLKNKGKAPHAEDRIPALHGADTSEAFERITTELDQPFDSIGLAA